MPRYQLYVDISQTNSLTQIRRALKENGYRVFNSSDKRIVKIETHLTSEEEVRQDLNQYEWVNIILPVSNPISIETAQPAMIK